MIAHPLTLPENPARSTLAAAGDETAIDILARTLWSEAHDESVRVKEAVAATLVNRTRLARARHGHDWWGTTIPEVCLAGDRFPFWRREVEGGSTPMPVPPDDPTLPICRRIAARAVRGALADPTFGATRYHGPDGKPSWVGQRRPSIRIGGFRFYRDES